MTGYSDGFYKDLVERLMFLDTVEQIRQAVASVPRLESGRLRTALEARMAALQNEGRPDECGLLSIVTEAVDSVLTTPEAPREVSDVRDLVLAASRQDRLLGMRRVLRTHRELLTSTGLDELFLSTAEGWEQASDADRLRQSALVFIATSMAGTPAQRVDGCLLIASYFRERGDLRRAHRLLAKAKRSAPSGDTETRRKVLGAQSALYSATGQHAKALAIIDEALELATAERDVVHIVSFRRQAARLARKLGHYGRALDDLDAAVALLERAPSSTILVGTLRHRGLVQEHLRRYDRSAQDFERALELARDLHDREYVFLLSNDMGASYLKRAMPWRAYDHYRRLLRVVESWGNPVALGATYNNIGSTLLDLKRPSEAFSAYAKGLSLKGGSGFPRSDAIALRGMANALVELGDLKGARGFLQAAYANGIEQDDPQTLTECLLDMTRPPFLANANDALALLRSAEELVRARGAMWQATALALQIVHLHKAKGQMDEALRVYREWFQRCHPDPRAPEQLEMIIGYAEVLAQGRGGPNHAYCQLESARAVLDSAQSDIVDNTWRAEAIAQHAKLHDAMIKLLVSPAPPSVGLPSGPSVHAFELHESTKSRSTLSTLAMRGHQPPPRVPRELADEEHALLVTRRALQGAEYQGSEVQREKRLRDIHERLQGCWSRMKPLAPEYVRYRAGQPYGFEEIRAALDRLDVRAAFVSFFCTDAGTTVFLLQQGEREPTVWRLPEGDAEWRGIVRRLHRAFNGNSNEFPPFPPIRRDQPEKRSIAFLSRANKLLEFVAAVQDV
ncbi:MAG: tetratricopeptide repeat protein, partial [Myxococcales bacterium]|nr:tetratricopeptide repeat protein [Myxococcales bacterium]